MRKTVDREAFFRQVQGGLIVSCQALPEEPLHSPFIMSRMAYAAMEGGAVGIRANTVPDIGAIRSTVKLPIIGIIKRDVPDSEIFITPAMEQIDDLYALGVEVIALDATDRLRPGGESLLAFFARVRQKYPQQLFMADCSTVGEGLAAAKMGFDIIATTLAGYTPSTIGRSLPAFDMMQTLVRQCGKPVIAEGGISTPQELRQAMDTGILAAVVGSAITRPLEITRRFAAVLDP